MRRERRLKVRELAELRRTSEIAALHDELAARQSNTELRMTESSGERQRGEIPEEQLRMSSLRIMGARQIDGAPLFVAEDSSSRGHDGH